MGAKTSSTSSIEKNQDTFDKTSPTDFYGLFINTSKSGSKDEEDKVSRRSTAIEGIVLTSLGQNRKAETS